MPRAPYMYTMWKRKILLWCKLHWGPSCDLGEAKKQKKQKKHLLGNTHITSNKTKQENKLYEKVVTTFGGISTLRNGVEWNLTWVTCAQHMLFWIFVTSGYKIHEHRPVAKK